MRREFLAGLIILFAASARGDDKPPPSGQFSGDGIAFFEKKIRPLLVNKCYECHSASAKKVRGELVLDTRAALLKGGATGPAIVPGEPEKSLLIRAVRHIDDKLKMPKEKLADAEIADLVAWVKMGAPDPGVGSAKTARLDIEHSKEFWSFKPLHSVAAPAIRDTKHSIRNEIDRFILAKLQEKGLTPAPPTDKRTLIRRATYNLTGLPPTPDEIAAFLKDNSPGAFTKVVERLLASSAYGERWGRHWLDVVRYADTAGDNSDYPVPQMYRYRNWVLDAFNRDLPYDEFIRQQLAGDLLAAKDEADRERKLIATGYLANSKRFGSYEDARYPWYLTYEDTIDNLGRTFLGLTINCARCHDHKFDPISQQDYYALYGFFQSTRYPRPGIELDKTQHDFVPLATAEQVAVFEKERKAKAAELEKRVNDSSNAKEAYEIQLAAARKLKDETERAEKIEQLKKAIDAAQKELKTALKAREDFARAAQPFPTAYAVAELDSGGKKKVGNACVQIKGDPERLGPEVPRRFPTVLGGQTLPAKEKGSGRLELANWIADPKNPLTARVMVNRIWHYHFGRGIVPTPSNFGTLGQPPTHPELLDYLTERFIESGWSVKAMHRLIMLSGVYQMASRDDAANEKIDVGNEYLWRFNRQRLDAESIRDTLLAVGGNLDRKPGDAHPFPAMNTWNFTQHNPFKANYDTNRRSVYLMTQRIQRHPFLSLFDGADTNASTDRRTTSTTPLQALFLMNDPFVHAQAQKFAARVLADGKDDAARIERAYLLLFGRPPTIEETTAAKDYLAKVAAKLAGSSNPSIAWESLARALFMSNEFVYLD